MSISVNTFYAYLSQQLDAGGSETTIYLDRITTRTGETINTSDFATVGRGIIAVNPDGDGNTSFPEYISFTGVSGLTLTGATRGLSAKGNNVVAANKRFHPVGTPVVIAFGTHSLQDIFDYIDAEIGALTVGSNMVMSGLAGETVSAGQVVYLKDDGRWWLADADVLATINDVILGIAQGSGTAGNTITNGVLRKGTDSNQSGLTAGANYFVGNTAGAVSATAGTNTRKIGVGRSSTQLYFDPEYAQLPSPGEKAAMAGGGDFGTLSPTNKFVTEYFLATVLPKRTVYEVSGSPHTWTKPANLAYIEVELWGAGASGVSYRGSNTEDEGKGGGGGGAYRTQTFSASDLGTTVTVTVGQGGAAVSRTTDGVTNGNNGGNSSFGSHLVANGGNGGANRSGGNGGAVSFDFGTGGEITETATINGTFGGAGGGRGSSNGTYASGGNSIWGGGGGGPCADETNTFSGGTSINAGNGGAGSGNNAGSATATSGATPAGGGGAAYSNGGTATSGAGGNGRVIVVEYYL